MKSAITIQFDALLRGRPQAKAHASGARFGAEGHGMRALHAGPAGRVISTIERARKV